MFRLLLNYVLRGPLSAIGILVAATVLSLTSPPLSWLLVPVSAGLLALITLQIGGKQGGMVLFWTTAVVDLLSWWFLPGANFMTGLFTLPIWLPVWLLAWNLRTTQSLSWSFQLLALVSLALVLAVYVALPDPTAYWFKWLQLTMKPILLETGQFDSAEVVDQKLLEFARLATSFLISLWTLCVIISLLIGRSWQAMLFNPQGLRKEFERLRFDHLTGFSTLALLVLELLTDWPLVSNLTVIMTIVYAFCGLAVIQGIISALNAHSMWTVALYVLLFLVSPQMVIILALLGLTDTWFRFRERVATNS